MTYMYMQLLGLLSLGFFNFCPAVVAVPVVSDLSELLLPLGSFTGCIFEFPLLFVHSFPLLDLLLGFLELMCSLICNFCDKASSYTQTMSRSQIILSFIVLYRFPPHHKGLLFTTLQFFLEVGFGD